jgi:hypothetical protein
MAKSAGPKTIADPSPPDSCSAGELIVERVRVACAGRIAWLAVLAATPDIGDRASSFLTWQRTSQQGRWYVDMAARSAADLEISPAGAVRRKIIATFGLNAAERDLLDLCAALRIDPTLGGHLRELGAQFVSDRLARQIFAHTQPAVWRPGSPLAIWQLLESSAVVAGDEERLAIDPGIAAMLQGMLGLDACLVGRAQVMQALDGPAQWPLQRLSEQARLLLEEGASLRIFLRGPMGSGRSLLAAQIAQALGARLIGIDLEDVSDAAYWGDLFMRSQRLALAGSYALCWCGTLGVWPRHLAMAPLQFIACDPGTQAKHLPGVTDIFFDMPALSRSDRRDLWLAHAARASNWPKADLQRLSASSGALAGDIVAVARSNPPDAAEAHARIRQVLRARSESAGQLMDQPYDWSDLILPPAVIEALRDVVHEAINRDALIKTKKLRSLYRGLGLSALFCGPPGTGKTMAAQVLARDLDADLVRIDLAATVSKYIGETAKNLKRIFTHLGGSGVVLLFDEADSLFAKRTDVKDAHDRHANADTNYLLQLIEGFDGVALLATNKKDNIDPAFMRRMRHVIEFPQCQEPERSLLWRRHIETLGDHALNGLGETVDDLARSIELSPAQIKSAALNAIYRSGRRGAPLAPDDLVAGAERELAKEGRALARRDRERLLGNV